MSCNWKRCHVDGALAYLGVDLCFQHWSTFCEWVERLERDGPPLTAKLRMELLRRSTKRGKAWRRRSQ